MTPSGLEVSQGLDGIETLLTALARTNSSRKRGGFLRPNLAFHQIKEMTDSPVLDQFSKKMSDSPVLDQFP